MSAAFVVRERSKLATRTSATHFLGCTQRTETFATAVEGKVSFNTGGSTTRFAFVDDDQIGSWRVRLFRAKCASSTIEYFRNGKELPVFGNENIKLNGWQFGFLGGYAAAANGSTDGRFNGQIAEIILFNRFLSSEDAFAVEEYLLTKYDIAREASDVLMMPTTTESTTTTTTDILTLPPVDSAPDANSNSPKPAPEGENITNVNGLDRVTVVRGDTENETETEETLIGTSLIGGVIGAVLCLLGIAVILIVLLWKKKQNQRKRGKLAASTIGANASDADMDQMQSARDFDSSTSTIKIPEHYGSTSLAID